jgi:lysyl-tRNA synthetase class 2
MSEAAEAAGAGALGKSAHKKLALAVDLTQYFANRVSALEELKKGGGVPYPHKFKVDLSVPEFVHSFSGLADGERHDSSVVSIAGRIWSKRWSSQKLVFYDLRNDGSKVQVMADAASDSTGKFKEIHNLLRRCDIIGVVGCPCTFCPFFTTFL